MGKQKILYLAASLLVGGCMMMAGCSDDEPNIPSPEKPDSGSHENGRLTTDEQFYANHFAYDILDYYYYWNEQIASDLKKLDPEKNTDPIKTVDEIKYHQGSKFIDKWTMLTDDMAQFESGVAGVSTTYGYQPIVYRLANSNDLVAAIAFVYKDSPAEKAGLKRGDLIIKVDGKNLTEANYRDLFYTSNVTLSLAKITQSADGKGMIVPTNKDVNLTAVKMYEDPVLLDSVYEVNGKKMGYLAYSSFDLNSIPKLIEISKKFKAQGVKELILDFRYNGGGYVVTETAMASMYAPQDVVDAGKTFEIEKFNKELTKEFEKKGDNGETPFTTEFKFKDQSGKVYSYSTKGANIGIEKVYGLISPNSASASEALLSGLMPYMDVELIGMPSHGKYCTGWMVAAKDAYKKVPQPIKNWGIYVMVAIYQNAKGETPCMPDGLQPDLMVDDDPFLPEQFGDVNEQMLRAALERAGKVYDDKEVKSRSGMMNAVQPVEIPHKANFGKRILLSDQLPFRSE